MPTRFPLEWPEHWPRTNRHARRTGPFRTTHDRTRRDLMEELRKMNAANVVLSTGIPVRQDGMPYAHAREPDDPGAAVYFTWKGKPLVIACDAYEGVWSNVRAISKTVEAMRAIERNGASSLLERATAGFTALPPGVEDAEPQKPWWEVLELPGGLPYEELSAESTHPMRKAALQLAEVCYKQRVPDAHPDRGGSPKAMRELAEAIAQARAVLG